MISYLKPLHYIVWFKYTNVILLSCLSKVSKAGLHGFYKLNIYSVWPQTPIPFTLITQMLSFSMYAVKWKV